MLAAQSGKPYLQFMTKSKFQFLNNQFKNMPCGIDYEQSRICIRW